jgi:hypothetical protein
VNRGWVAVFSLLLCWNVWSKQGGDSPPLDLRLREDYLDDGKKLSFAPPGMTPVYGDVPPTQPIATTVLGNTQMYIMGNVESDCAVFLKSGGMKSGANQPQGRAIELEPDGTKKGAMLLVLTHSAGARCVLARNVTLSVSPKMTTMTGEMPSFGFSSGTTTTNTAGASMVLNYDQKITFLAETVRRLDDFAGNSPTNVTLALTYKQGPVTFNCQAGLAILPGRAGKGDGGGASVLPTSVTGNASIAF